jgi:hypothetical protein
MVIDDLDINPHDCISTNLFEKHTKNKLIQSIYLDEQNKPNKK